jgi:hypothetical protein
VRAHAAEAERQGARFLVCVIPYLMQVEDSVFTLLYRDLFGALGRPELEGLADWNAPEARLESFFHEHGLQHLQLLAPLRDLTARERRSPYVCDGHLDGTGHALMARELAGLLGQPGTSLCFRGDAHAAAVGLETLFGGEAPLRLDFTTREHRELVADGSLRWRPPGDAGGAGWALPQPGARWTLLLPTRRGGVSIEGRITHSGRFPLSVRLHENTGSRRELAAQTLEAPGSFSLRVPAGSLGEHESPWALFSVLLEAPGAARGEGTSVTALVTGLRAER